MARTIAVGDKALAGSGDYEPIPDGAKLRVALFDIDEVEVRNGPNAGKPQAEFTVKVVEDGPYKGREIRYNYFPLYAGAGNEWFLVAIAEALGWPVDKDSKAVSVPDNLKDALGTEFIARIRQEESNKVNPATGKPYVNNRVNGARKIKAGGGGGITDPAPAKQSWDSL